MRSSGITGAMSDTGHERLVVVSDALRERYGIRLPILEVCPGG